MAAGNVSIEASSWSREASEPAGSSGALPTRRSAHGGADLEVELARARLDQAEREMDSLKSRIDYLEARAASSVGATPRELEELMQVRDALGVEAAGVGGLSQCLEQRMQESAALAWHSWDEY
jgi:hypothetical protein